MRNLNTSIEDGAYSLYAAVTLVGQDISTTIYGGDKPHIGAAAISVPRPSLSDKTVLSSSTSVYCVTGHKEDEIAKVAAGRLSAEFGCVANVCVGIHIDFASASDIKRLTDNFGTLLEMLIEQLHQIH